MQKLLLTIDKVSTFVGQFFSWLIVALTLLISCEVFSRYVLDHPHSWAFDVMIIMYGTMFMMAGAYTLAKDGHVRGDVLYGFFEPRPQATIDLILYIVFFIPGVFALTYAGYFYAAESWAISESSTITADGPPLYPFKTMLPLAGAFLLVQGIVEIIRCVICIKQGDWPSRAEDVQEVDVDKLKEMVHVKDEDIHKLDKFVAPQGETQMKIRKELWFGFALMAIILVTVVIYTPWSNFADGHLSRDDLGSLGLLMLALIVVAIMLGFPTAFTLMGMGVLFGWLAYRSVNPGTRDPADPGPDGAACLLGDVQRRADRDPALRVHGLPGRTCEPDRETVQEPAPGARAPARRTGGGDDRDLRHLCNCIRHRRRRGHADGPARAAGDAARRLQHQGGGRCDHGRRLPGHPDPAFGTADRLWRNRWRVGGQAVRGRVLPRHHARQAFTSFTSSSWPNGNRIWRHPSPRRNAGWSCRRCPRL